MIIDPSDATGYFRFKVEARLQLCGLAHRFDYPLLHPKTSDIYTSRAREYQQELGDSSPVSSIAINLSSIGKSSVNWTTVKFKPLSYLTYGLQLASQREDVAKVVLLPQCSSGHGPWGW